MATPSFSVARWSDHHQGPCASVRVTAPKQVSCWTLTSVTAGGRYLYNNPSGLLPYCEPSLPADLNEGFSTGYIQKDDSKPTRINPVIESCIQAGVILNTCDVCTFRNNLNKVCLTILDAKQPWTVDACQLHQNSTTFLDIVKAEDGRNFPDSDVFMYYGYKFESLCTGGRLVDSSSEFASVVRYKLGGMRMIMAAEIDCFDPAALGDDLQDRSRAFVELKTYRLPSNASFDAKMKAEKYPRWWVQSFLGGVRHMALGGRDGDGMLQKVRKVRVIDLPAESAQAGRPWDPWRLIQFGVDLLEWMRGCTASHPGVHLRFNYNPSTMMVEMQMVPDGDLPDLLRGLLANAAPPT